jgi:hypothetical protein
MIEAGPQKAVVLRLGDDLGHLKACHVTGVQRTARPGCDAAVSVRGYNPCRK